MIINILYYFFLRFMLLCLFNREYRRMFFLHLKILLMTMKMVMHLKKKMLKKLMINNKMMSHSLSSLIWLTFITTYLLGRPSNVYEFVLIVWTLFSMEAIVGVMYLFVVNF